MKTFKEHLQENQNDTIEVYDIDDTLLFSNSKIYYTEPGKPQKSALSGEFAKIRDKLHNDTVYDWSDFHEFKNSYMGIVRGAPNIPILKQMDRAIAANHKIGILTARGAQSAVLAAIKDKILVKDKDGRLKKIPRKFFRKKFLFAVGDNATLKAFGADKSTEELKAHVLQKIFADKMGFKNVVLYDDDMANLKAVNNLNDPRIKGIKVQ